MKQNVYIRSLIELTRDILNGIAESTGKIAVLLQILFPVIITMTNTTLLQKAAISCVWAFLVTYLGIVDRKINRRKKNGMPLPPCKLTTTDKAGFVEIIEGRTEAAIIYLSDIEDWIEKHKESYTG